MVLNLSLFSKFRTELMGTAALFIIICHMPAHGVIMPSLMASLLGYGGLGCDMFLFLSGMGMWFSLRKNPTTNGVTVFHWMIRRYLRVLIPYLLFVIPCFAFFAYVDDWPLTTYFWRLSTLSYWNEGWGLWYLSLTLVLYLLTPIIDHIFASTRKWLWLTIFVSAAWIFSWFHASETIIQNVQFCMARVPGYLLGIAMAEYIKKEVKVSWRTLLLPLAVLFIFGIIVRIVSNFTVGLAWIEGMFLLIVSAKLIECIKKRFFIVILKFVGKISLESYCTNVFALMFFSYIPWHIANINMNPGNWTYYIIGTLCCLYLSYVIHSISGRIIESFRI